MRAEVVMQGAGPVGDICERSPVGCKPSSSTSCAQPRGVHLVQAQILLAQWGASPVGYSGYNGHFCIHIQARKGLPMSSALR